LAAGDVLNTHSEYPAGQEMVTAPLVGTIVNCGGASGVCDMINALYGPMVTFARAGLPLAVTIALPAFP
jgi:hypothetical protein